MPSSFPRRRVERPIREAGFLQSSGNKQIRRDELVDRTLEVFGGRPPETILTFGGRDALCIRTFRERLGPLPRIISIDDQKDPVRFGLAAELNYECYYVEGGLERYCRHGIVQEPRRGGLFFKKVAYDFPKFDLAFLDLTSFPLRRNLDPVARFISQEMRTHSVAGCTFLLTAHKVDVRDNIRDDLRHLSGRPDITARNTAAALVKLIDREVEVHDINDYDTTTDMAFFTVVQRDDMTAILV